jgi:hypothetical protein
VTGDLLGFDEFVESTHFVTPDDVHVTLFSVRVTLHVTLCSYAELKGRAGDSE